MKFTNKQLLGVDNIRTAHLELGISKIEYTCALYWALKRLAEQQKQEDGTTEVSYGTKSRDLSR